MKTILDYIKIKQKNKYLYSASIDAETLYSNGEIIRQSESKENGIQRYLDSPRVNSIATYCKEKTDAPLFMTPIVVSLNSDYVISDIPNDTNQSLGTITLNYDDSTQDLFSIIDGQHRLMGIKKYEEEGGKKLKVLISFVFDADVYQSADMFLTINSNQKSVDWSTMYSLFGLMETKSGKPTIPAFASKVAFFLNANENSPFFNGIKMLGRKTSETQFISQATVAHKIAANTWPKKNGQHRTFTPFYLDANFEFVAKLIMNTFNSFRSVYPDVWEDPNGLAKKSIGYSAIMNFLIDLMKHEKDITYNNLKIVFFNIGVNLISDNNELKKELLDGGLESLKKDLKLKEEFNKFVLPIMKELFNKEKGSSESVARNISNDLIESYLQVKKYE